PEIVAVVGHICSGSTIAGSEIYEEARIPMMSPSATNATVTERGLDVVNRVAFRDDVQGMVDANYMYKVLGITKIAIMHDNDSYGLGLAEVVQAEFERLGGEVVAFEGINVDDQDFRPVLTALVPAEPEAIFFGGYVQQAVLLVPQKADVGLEDVIFFTDDGVFGPAFIDGAGDAAEGVYASFAEPGQGSEEAIAAFYEKYDEMFGETTGPFHLHAYDSAKMIFNAIDAASEVDADGNLVIDREALIAALRGTADYEGLTGMLTCDEKGDCAAGSIAINLVEDGEWVQVELPEDLIAE
ncbi:MAG: branched-chain amino acid ABC transporter substrate-binding protein, partial [Anaerolineae bacterium]|nr:branched-chain amino acid ABC transporter substrate-binding protein [Anaerolineae bacterium]